MSLSPLFLCFFPYPSQMRLCKYDVIWLAAQHAVAPELETLSTTNHHPSIQQKTTNHRMVLPSAQGLNFFLSFFRKFFSSIPSHSDKAYRYTYLQQPGLAGQFPAHHHARRLSPSLLPPVISYSWRIFSIKQLPRWRLRCTTFPPSIAAYAICQRFILVPR